MFLTVVYIVVQKISLVMLFVILEGGTVQEKVKKCSKKTNDSGLLIKKLQL